MRLRAQGLAVRVYRTDQIFQSVVHPLSPISIKIDSNIRANIPWKGVSELTATAPSQHHEIKWLAFHNSALKAPADSTPARLWDAPLVGHVAALASSGAKEV